jgi:hypothetical protein
VILSIALMKTRGGKKDDWGKKRFRCKQWIERDF